MEEEEEEEAALRGTDPVYLPQVDTFLFLRFAFKLRGKVQLSNIYTVEALYYGHPWDQKICPQ